MSSVMTFNAREAYHDCLRFFEESIQPSMEAALSGGPIEIEFSGELTPLSEFEIEVTATHAALVAFVSRYPAAEFTFHSERNRIPGVSDQDLIADPLSTQYATFTINFTPYGTVFGGGTDHNGGNGTRTGTDSESTTTDAELESPGPMAAPSGPSGPGTDESPIQTPATA